MLYLELFLTFFKIGLFTIGGGYAMLPLIQADVQAKGWMTAEELVNFIAVSESTPGPFAVNVSTYVGAELAGLPGAFCATLGVVLPSFLIILLVARFYAAFRSSAIVSGAIPMPAETSDTARPRPVSNQPVTQAIIGANTAAVAAPTSTPNSA